MAFGSPLRFLVARKSQISLSFQLGVETVTATLLVLLALSLGSVPFGARCLAGTAALNVPLLQPCGRGCRSAPYCLLVASIVRFGALSNTVTRT